MELTKQVCSLELAQKLKALEVKQESCFRWFKDGVHGFNEVKSWGYEEGWGDEEFWIDGVSAFTVAELGEMLLPLIPVQIKKQWEAPSPKNQTVQRLGAIADVTEADARVKMLIYLIENKLQTI